jgi:hypothetical protein
VADWRVHVINSQRAIKRLSQVGIDIVFDAFEEGESETIPALVPDRQVREYEVRSALWLLQVSGTCHGDTSQHRDSRRRVHLPGGDWSSNL